MTRLAPFLLLLLLSSFFTPCIDAEEYSIVDSRPKLPLIVDGVEVSPHQLPLHVSPGSTICVPGKVVYADIDRRYVFERWSHGGRDLCAQAPVNDTLTAMYREEVLVQVFSEVEEYSMSTWVTAGARINLTVEPIVYDEPGVRYVFVEWSGGERPFDPQNYVAAVNPVKLRVTWERQYLLSLTSSPHRVQVNGTGWYKAGEVAVIAAPREILLEEGRRLVFEEWVSVGPVPAIVNNPSSPVTTLIVDGPHRIQARYGEYLMVEVYGVEGEVVYRAWVRRGEQIQVDVEKVIEVIPNEVRYVFRGWNESTVPQLPTFTIQVDEPLSIRSLYERQYYVRLASEYGGLGEGWYPENSTALIQVPPTPQTVLFLRRVFKGWEGNLQSGTSNPSPRLLLRVDKPLSLRAVYTMEIDLPSLAAVIGVASALTFVGLYGFRGKQRGEKPREKELLAYEKITCPSCKGEVVYYPQESRPQFCPSCGAELPREPRIDTHPALVE